MQQDQDESFKTLVMATIVFGAIFWIGLTGRLPNPPIDYKNLPTEVPRNASNKQP